MNTTNASEAIPSSQAFTLVGVTYGLYGLGLFLVWPTLIGVVIAYVKRHDVPELLSSHYRWLINTFWWWVVAWTVIMGAMLAVMIPHARNRERRRNRAVFQHSVGTDRRGRSGWLGPNDRLVMGRLSIDPRRSSSF